MPKILLLWFLLFLFSCAKTGYLIEQGIGQVGLEWNAVNNDRVLMDPKVSDEHKEKIRLILKAKDYFYKYFKIEPTGIYDETTFLESDAVTHLVIVSRKDQIKAEKVHFPIVGSFPYLGFFNEKSAKEYADEKKSKGFSTYTRKVYAYSTLNQWIFDDNILSSFFQLKDRQLVELIFHELVHTIIFVSNDVAFNENLAEVISRKLSQEYFEDNTDKINAIKKRQTQSKQLRQLIVEKSRELNQLYSQTTDYEKTLDRFLREDFNPNMKKQCDNFELKKCWPLEGTWNNARFAALGTYSSKQDRIEKLFSGSQKNLKEFFGWIQKMYDKFEGKGKFLDYLEREMK